MFPQESPNRRRWVLILCGSALVVIGIAILVGGTLVGVVSRRADAAAGAPGDAWVIAGLVVALLGIALQIASVVVRAISRRSTRSR